MAEDPIMARGADVQQRFHFYLIGLTFGILALSIETASFDTPLLSRIGELLGWVLLLVSGVVGLWRIEWLPKHYLAMGLDDQIRERAHELQKSKLMGTSVVHVTLERKDYPIDQLLATADADLTTLKAHLKTLDRRASVKYNVQKVTFVLGLVALMVSRGLGPVTDIMLEIRA